MDARTITSEQALRNFFGARFPQQLLDRRVDELSVRPAGLDNAVPLDYFGTGADIPPLHARERADALRNYRALYEGDFSEIADPINPFTLKLQIFKQTTNVFSDWAGNHNVTLTGLPAEATEAETLLAKRNLSLLANDLGVSGNTILTSANPNTGQSVTVKGSETVYTARDGYTIVETDTREEYPNHFVTVTTLPFAGTGRVARYVLLDGASIGRLIDGGEFAVPSFPIVHHMRLYPFERGQWGTSPYVAMVSAVRQATDIFSRWIATNRIYERPVTTYNKAGDNLGGKDPEATGKERTRRAQYEYQRLAEFWDNHVQPIGMDDEVRIVQWDPQQQSVLFMAQEFLKFAYNSSVLTAAFYGVGNGEALRNGQSLTRLEQATMKALDRIMDDIAETYARALESAYRLTGQDLNVTVDLELAGPGTESVVEPVEAAA